MNLMFEKDFNVMQEIIAAVQREEIKEEVHSYPADGFYIEFLSAKEYSII